MDKPLALLIEDDRDVSALFKHVLDMAGYESENIYDGIEALKRLSEIQPDIVLLDLQLPGISGIDIFQKMRADERMKNIPVIVITAYAFFAKSQKIVPDLFLLKPVDIHDLSNLLRLLRDKKDTLREPPYDIVTHLYTESFFSVRLIFAVERVKRLELESFGVLFADLRPFKELQEKLGEEVLNVLLRKIADQFKGLLRPEDTLAWSQDGYFLSLFEEIATDSVPILVAKQVEDGLNDFIKLHELGEDLQAQVGVIKCDDGYQSAQHVLDDVDFARTFIKSQLGAGHWVFSRKDIRQMRDAQGN